MSTPKVVFIIGSPRSGTTLLGDILNRHSLISRWYEPLFVTDRYFRNAPDDCRSMSDANEEIKWYIRHAFEYYRRRERAQVVVDKSPQNSLKIPFLRTIFPEAKFIHILRDGRDVTFSIHREWQKRVKILTNRNLFQALRSARKWLARQPLIKHKILALLFEIGRPRDILQGHSPFRVSRWKGRNGWGPQFAGWQSVIDRVSVLEFNAFQWVKCTEAVLADSCYMTADCFLEIRYEKLLKEPQVILDAIFAFLEVPFPIDSLIQPHELRTSNSGHWREVWSSAEKAQLGPILQPMLSKLGYASDNRWYFGHEGRCS